MKNTMMGEVPELVERVQIDVNQREPQVLKIPAAVVVEKKNNLLIPILIGAGVLYFIISKKFFKK